MQFVYYNGSRLRMQNAIDVEEHKKSPWGIQRFPLSLSPSFSGLSLCAAAAGCASMMQTTGHDHRVSERERGKNIYFLFCGPLDRLSTLHDSSTPYSAGRFDGKRQSQNGHSLLGRGERTWTHSIEVGWD